MRIGIICAGDKELIPFAEELKAAFPDSKGRKGVIMSDEAFEMYMKYHLTVCEREDMVGATSHMLDIFKKE